MKKFNVFAVSILGMASLLLSGCNRAGNADVEMVKKSYVRLNSTKTVGQAFDNYKYFKSREWKPYTESGNHFVKFTAEVDISNRLTPEYYDRMNKEGKADIIVKKVDMVFIFYIDRQNKKFNIIKCEYVYYRANGKKGYGPEELENVINPIYNNELLKIP